MKPYVLNQQMLILAFFFAAMVIQRKDLYGLSYLQLEYFAWVQVLPLCMEFKIYGILKYVTEVSFESWELYAQNYIFIIKCHESPSKYDNAHIHTFVWQPPENIHWAALVIGGSFLIEGVARLLLPLSPLHFFLGCLF